MKRKLIVLGVGSIILIVNIFVIVKFIESANVADYSVDAEYQSISDERFDAEMKAFEEVLGQMESKETSSHQVKDEGQVNQKDVSSSENGGNDSTGDADSSGNTGSADGTGNVGSADSAGNTGSADSTGNASGADSAGNVSSTDGAGNTGSADGTGNASSTDVTGNASNADSAGNADNAENVGSTDSEGNAESTDNIANSDDSKDEASETTANAEGDNLPSDEFVAYTGDEWIDQQVNMHKDKVDEQDMQDGMSLSEMIDTGVVYGYLADGLTDEERVELKAYFASVLTPAQYSRLKELFYKYNYLLDE